MRKRMSACVLALCMACVLCACGGGGDAPAPPVNSTLPPVEDVTPPEDVQPSDTSQRDNIYLNEPMEPEPEPEPEKLEGLVFLDAEISMY